MKYLKKILIVFTFLLVSTIAYSNIKPQSSASAVQLNESVFNYVSISTHEQQLKMENFKTVDNTTYIIANDSITINLKPLQYMYTIPNISLSACFIPTYNQITIEYDEELEKYPNFFTYNNTTYYYSFSYNNIYDTNILSIYSSSPEENSLLSPIVTSRVDGIQTLKIEQDDTLNIRTITILQSYTLNPTIAGLEETFTFSVASSQTFTLNFLKPVVKFANAENPILRFNCEGLDAGEGFSDTTIPSLQTRTYNQVSIDFLNNDYSQYNQLFFKINRDGFVYDFEFFTKEYNGQTLLFVNYIDPTRSQTIEYLATELKDDMAINSIPAYINNAMSTFSLEFKETGRYEIEIYDSTYLYGLKNANYDKFSFFIREITDKNDAIQSAYDNINLIAQTQDDEGNDLEYIVSTSTLNNNIKLTIKNLTNLGTDNAGKEIKLSDVIDYIKITKTIFVGGENIHVYDYYHPAVPQQYANDKNHHKITFLKNGDFVLNYSEDAIYQIEIFKKNSAVSAKYYEFTVVKLTKVAFSVPQIDEITGEAKKDENGKTLLRNDSATNAFMTDTHHYTMNIRSEMNLKIKVSYNQTTLISDSKKLNKIYVNKYSISYGIERVLVEHFEPEKKDNNSEEEVPETYDIKCFGVGDLTVTVTFNGKETVYDLNSEAGNNIVQFFEYGTYTVQIVDSMGTTEVFEFVYKKELNTSALLLIGLSGIIVLVIVIFVLRARAKIGTR